MKDKQKEIKPILGKTIVDVGSLSKKGEEKVLLIYYTLQTLGYDPILGSLIKAIQTYGLSKDYSLLHIRKIL